MDSLDLENSTGVRSLGKIVSEILEYIPESYHDFRHVFLRSSCACSGLMGTGANVKPTDCTQLFDSGLIIHLIAYKYISYADLYLQ